MNLDGKGFPYLLTCAVMGAMFCATAAFAQDQQPDIEESTVEEPPTEQAAPTPEAEVEAPSAAVPPQSPPSRPKRIFGGSKFRIGAGKPKFDDNLKCYDKIYGSTAIYPTFGFDYYLFDWFATLGGGMRAGYYKKSGTALKPAAGQAVETGECSEYVEDPNDKLDLTLIPLQLVASMQLTPFRGKWVVLDFWAGYERLYFQETRVGVDEAKGTTTASDDSGDKTLTNQGWKNAVVFGGAVNILLNSLDERSIFSLNRAMGIGYVYMAPFFEVVRATKKEGVSWGRTAYGLTFNFETSK